MKNSSTTETSSNASKALGYDTYQSQLWNTLDKKTPEPR